MFDIKEQLIKRLENTGIGSKPAKIFSIDEAEEYIQLNKNIIIISFRDWNDPINKDFNKDLVLLTNDYCFGTCVYNRNWKNSSYLDLMNLAPHKSIKNIKNRLDVFYPETNRILIETIDGFADWLIKTNSFYTAEQEKEIETTFSQYFKNHNTIN